MSARLKKVDLHHRVMENWWAKLVTFLIVFFLFWLLAGVMLKNATWGFVIGVVVAAIFGVSTLTVNATARGR